MNEPKPVFERDFDVRWNDMDALGHVTHSVYFEYCSQTRIDWFKSLGRRIVDGNVGPVIVHTECTYRRPIEYPATVRDRCYVTKVGRSSFSVRHEVCVVGDEALRAEHRATIVWCNYDTGESVALPGWLRDELAGAP